MRVATLLTLGLGYAASACGGDPVQGSAGASTMPSTGPSTGAPTGAPTGGITSTSQATRGGPGTAAAQTSATDNTGDTTGAGVDMTAAYIFDDDVLRTYELVVAPEDWAWLQANAALEQYVQATLEFEGESWGPIGLRFKGGGSLSYCTDAAGALNNQCAKVSMKLDFNEYDDAGRFYGLKKLNLHSEVFDASLLRERLAYSLWQDMDVVAPRAVHAQVVVNGTPLGVFGLVEQVDGRFTRDRFVEGGEGNLYKGIWPQFPAADDWAYLGALRTNELMPDVSNMIAFADSIQATTAQDFVTVLGEWTDVDALIRYMAVDRAIENWDGITRLNCGGNYCYNHNYYWYEEVLTGQMHLIPWDMDGAFYESHWLNQNWPVFPWYDTALDCTPTDTLLPPGCDHIIGLIADTSWAPYVAASQELHTNYLTDAAIEAKLTKWEAQLADAVATDPMHGAQWQGALIQLRADIAVVVQAHAVEISM